MPYTIDMAQRACATLYRASLFFVLSACGQANDSQNTRATAEKHMIELTYPANAAQADVKHCIIWLHGLGATADDFPPIVPHLGLDTTRPIRFIFPQAPDRPITINGGFVMPGWHDIKGLDLASKEDREGMEESRATVEQIISTQLDLGIEADKIILAGFSQGGAVTYYTGTRTEHKLAGLLTLSTYLVFLEATAGEQSDANQSTPIFASHGTQDPVVTIELGELSVKTLQGLGYDITWETYPMQHEVSLPQIQAIGHWINTVFEAQTESR